MYRVFFSLVLYKQSLEELEILIENISSFERLASKNNIEVRLLILDNSPIKLNHYFNDFGFIKYIFNNKNIGFGRGHNQNLLNINFRTTDIYLIINPDITFKADELVKYVDNFSISNYVCMAPLIKNPGRKIQYTVKKDPTVLSLFLSRFNFLTKITIFKNYYNQHINYNFDYLNDKINSSYLSGCFLLVKAKTFNKVKGFDPDYFLHLEDADFSRKCSIEGEVIHNPECTVFHKWARGSHKSLRQMYFLIKSMFTYFNKWGFKIF